MVLRKSFYIRWSAGRSPRVHEVNPGRDLSEQTKKKNQLCLIGFLVRVDVYLIHLHLKNFLGTHETYFSYYSFTNMISLRVYF